jgi:hypothetical protein
VVDPHTTVYIVKTTLTSETPDGEQTYTDECIAIVPEYLSALVVAGISQKFGPNEGVDIFLADDWQWPPTLGETWISAPGVWDDINWNV